MSGKLNYKTAWFFLLMIALAVFAIVAVPVWLIQPFAAQTDAKLQISDSSEMVDAETGSSWDFSGKATGGELAGKQLEKIAVLKDYWFDWKIYHADTQVYNLGSR